MPPERDEAMAIVLPVPPHVFATTVLVTAVFATTVFARRSGRHERARTHRARRCESRPRPDESSLFAPVIVALTPRTAGAWCSFSLRAARYLGCNAPQHA
jgi:hypothetical protein